LWRRFDLAGERRFGRGQGLGREVRQLTEQLVHRGLGDRCEGPDVGVVGVDEPVEGGGGQGVELRGRVLGHEDVGDLDHHRDPVAPLLLGLVGELVGRRHAGNGADDEGREALHDEAVECGLVDPAEQGDERLDLAVGPGPQIEVVREPHDRADSEVVLAGLDPLQRAAAFVAVEVVDLGVVVEARVNPDRFRGPTFIGSARSA
jgi:hypothetical protein